MKAVLKYIGGVILMALIASVYMTWWGAGLPERVSRALDAQEHEAGRFTMTDYVAKLDKGMHSEDVLTLDGQRIPSTLTMRGRKGVLVLHLPDGTDRKVFVSAEIEPYKVTYHYRFALEDGGYKTWDKSFTIDELNKSAQARTK
jgi:hypothetical protein